MKLLRFQIDKAASENNFLSASEKAGTLLQTARVENFLFHDKKSVVAKIYAVLFRGPSKPRGGEVSAP